MIKIEVPCTTILTFRGGIITGSIVISPNSLIDSIFINTTLSYSCAERSSVAQLVAYEKVQRTKKQVEQNVILEDGVVHKDYAQMSLHDAMDLLVEYVNLDKLISLLNDDNLNTGDSMKIQDFVKLRDYVYACDECNYVSETVQVKFD